MAAKSLLSTIIKTAFSSQAPSFFSNLQRKILKLGPAHFTTKSTFSIAKDLPDFFHKYWPTLRQ